MKRTVVIITDILQATPRIPGLLQYLKNYNWNAIVITPTFHNRSDLPFEPPQIIEDESVRVIETSYPQRFYLLKKILGIKSKRNIRKEVMETYNIHKNIALMSKIFNVLGSIFNFPDSDKKWENIAIKYVQGIMNENRVDLIVSSSSPVVSHIIANKIHKKYNIPWVADLRDLWSQNHNYYYIKLRRYLDIFIERRVMKNAKAIITVSNPDTYKEKKLLNSDNVYTITNGFHYQEKVFDVNLDKKFSVIYTGNLYYGKQNVEDLFIVLSKMKMKHQSFSLNSIVNIYTPHNNWIYDLIIKYELEDVVKLQKVISRGEAIIKQNRAQILLFFAWVDEKEKGCYSLKIFEYLAAKRPIISVGGKGDVVEVLLNRTQAGYYCKNIDDLYLKFENCYIEYIQKGKVSYKGIDDEINMYSFEAMTKKFIDIFNYCVK